MTTAEAVASGTRVAAARQNLQDNPNQRGLKTRLAETEYDEPFKDVSAFMKFFPNWNMVDRIACDPAHQFYNLVKDFLALIGDFGTMALKRKYLDAEQKNNRFMDVELGKAPWHISMKYKNILTQYLKTLKIPNSWPMMLNYFSDEYEKIKIAEALAFTGQIGSYFIDLTDIPSEEIKGVFIEMLSVCGQLMDKCSPSKSALKALHEQLVSRYCL